MTWYIFAAFPQRMMGMDSVPMLNGTSGARGGEDYQHWVDSQAAQAKSASTQVYSNTLPVRKVAPTKSKSTLGKHMNPLRSLSLILLLKNDNSCNIHGQ